MKLTVQGSSEAQATTYRVRVPYNSIKRTFEIIEGANAGTSLAYTHIRDIRGTGYTFSMTIEPEPGYRSEYDALYQVLSDPNNDYVTVTLPYGQGTITFKAEVKGGTDTFNGVGTDTFNGVMSRANYWGGLSVTFAYIAPYRTPQ